MEKKNEKERIAYNWRVILNLVRQEASEVVCRTWLNTLIFEDVLDDVVYVKCTDDSYYSCVDKKNTDLIVEALKVVMNKMYKVVVIFESDDYQELHQAYLEELGQKSIYNWELYHRIGYTSEQTAYYEQKWWWLKSRFEIITEYGWNEWCAENAKLLLDRLDGGEYELVMHMLLYATEAFMVEPAVFASRIDEVFSKMGTVAKRIFVHEFVQNPANGLLYKLGSLLSYEGDEALEDCVHRYKEFIAGEGYEV